jgi:hypothetical protein
LDGLFTRQSPFDYPQLPEHFATERADALFFHQRVFGGCQCLLDRMAFGIELADILAKGKWVVSEQRHNARQSGFTELVSLGFHEWLAFHRPDFTEMLIQPKHHPRTGYLLSDGIETIGGVGEHVATADDGILTEIKLHDAVLRVLGHRKWMLRYIENDDTGCFITSDMPVVLTWNDLENVPVMMRQSPGYRMTHTEVLFPLSRQLCVVEEFDGASGTEKASEASIAAANFRMIQHCYDHFFSPKHVIPYLGPDKKYYKDRHVM